MFSLMGNCTAWAKSKRKSRLNVTILTVGLDNAGKTTTIQHQLKGDLSDIAPTLGFSAMDLRSGRFNVKIFDLGGGARIRGIWHNYLAETHGLIFVVDSSDLDRMDECRVTLESLLSDERIKRKPVLILANKQDQPVALCENDICVRLNLEEIANRNECFCKLVLCSALPMKYSKLRKRKVDRGIKNGFAWLLDMIGNNFEKIQERVDNDVENQKEKEAQDKLERMERVRKIREERERQENSKDKTNQRCDDGPNSSESEDGGRGQSQIDLDGVQENVEISQPNLTTDMSSIVREVEEKPDDQVQEDSVRFTDSPLPGSVQREDSDSDGKNNIHNKMRTPSLQYPMPLGSNVDVIAEVNKRPSSAQSDRDKEDIHTIEEDQTWATESVKKPQKKRKKKRQTNKVKPIATESTVENNCEAFGDDENIVNKPSISPLPTEEIW